MRLSLCLLAFAVLLYRSLGSIVPDPALESKPDQHQLQHQGQDQYHHQQQQQQQHYAQHHLHRRQQQEEQRFWRHRRSLTGWSKHSPLYPAEAERDPFYPATISCRYFCPRPDYHLYLPRHWYYCCLPNTPGATHVECPAQTGHCRSRDPLTSKMTPEMTSETSPPAVTPEVTALLTCHYDSQCPFHRDLCCYDVCHRRNVCKRATLSHVPHFW